jgi:hypothetical protein
MNTGEKSTPWTFDRQTFAVAGLVVAGLFGYHLYQFWEYSVDDAFITLRYARNAVHGYGLVYNPGGPRVEGYSNPLLLLFQCIVMFCGGDALLWTKGLGAAAGYMTLAGSVAIALDLLRWADEKAARLSPVVAAAGAFVIGDSAPLATGCVSGLETSLFAALATWGTWGLLRVLQRERERVAAIVGGVCVGLSAWTRPEGILLAAAVAGLAVLIAVLRRRPIGGAVIVAAISLGLWLVLEAFRLVVFGDFQPNTYYAKMCGEAFPRLVGGARYLRAWTLEGRGYLLLIPAAVGGLLALPAMRVPALSLLAIALLFLGIAAYEGGDWIPWFRFIAPALGVLGGAASVGLGLVAARLAGRRSWGFSLIATVVFCILAHVAVRADFVRAIGEVQTRVLGWYDGHRALGQWLGAWRMMRGGELPVALADIGMVGWYSGAHLEDFYGLVDRDWARESFRTKGKARYPTRQLLLEKKPEVIVLIATERPYRGKLRIPWRPDRDVFHDPEFARRYRHRTVFVHKDFPRDGYYLHVFLRRDVYDEAPPVEPPIPRASAGW